MQKFILLFVSLFSFLNVIAQNCNLNDEAKRHMLKAEGMRETMQTSDDMQLVANEYEQAAQAAPYCPNIYYNLGLCYEELGKKQPELFDKAITCYQKYLQLSPSAENKSTVENLIYKIEGKKEMAKKQQQNELEKDIEKYVGRWKYFIYVYSTNFKMDVEWEDIEIFISQNKLYARVTSIDGVYHPSSCGDNVDDNRVIDSQIIPINVEAENTISLQYQYKTMHFCGGVIRNERTDFTNINITARLSYNRIDVINGGYKMDKYQYYFIKQ